MINRPIGEFSNSAGSIDGRAAVRFYAGSVFAEKAIVIISG
jgi:hypothetical protein